MEIILYIISLPILIDLKNISDYTWLMNDVTYYYYVISIKVIIIIIIIIWSIYYNPIHFTIFDY